MTKMKLTRWQCGTPKINVDVLAPYHTGQQLLRMPQREFISRCQGTEGVTEEQATVLHSNLWRMHLSQQPLEAGHSSVVSDKTPFKQRLRPGMVVKLRRAESDEKPPNYAMILSPVAFGSRLTADKTSYTCAQVASAMFRNAFTLNIWKQQVVKEEDMESEVVLEYDEATRYYFLGL
jgi:kinesin family protein 2/24